MGGCLSLSTRDGVGTSSSVGVQVVGKGAKGQCRWVTVPVVIWEGAVWGLRMD